MQTGSMAITADGVDQSLLSYRHQELITKQ